MNDIIGRFRGLLLDSRKDNINELERKIGRFLTAPEMPEPPPHENLWTVTGHVRTLAEGWASPSSRYHRDPEIARHMNRLWEHAHRFIHPGCAFEGNWWGWQIGIPENLGDSLLLAADAFSPENRQSMIASLRYLVENVWDFHPGANALWAALVYVRFGLATGEENHLDLARTWVDRSCEISDWQGILKDYSYSFHGHGINLGYGALHFNYVGRFVYLMENSRWRMKEHTLGNVVNMLLEFAQWQIVGKTIDPFIIDRGISAKDDQASEIAANLIDGALLLSSGPIPRGDEVRQCCRKILDHGCLPRNPVAIELAARLQGSAVPPLYGMRYWPETEHFVARQPGWTVAVKMASEKNKAYFGINRTNLKGWHISDGHLVFRMNGDEFLDDTLATMDWERLTGITRAASFKLPEETRGQSWFACGVTNRRANRGCCCLDFMLRTLDRHMLTARKSWFFLGDAVVAMGTGISCSNDDEVETIVQQIKLPDTRITEGEASHEAEILAGPVGSYVFPNRTSVRIRVECRAGRWSDLRADVPLSPLIVKPYWLAFIPHGRHPQNDSYLYVYLPGMNAERAERWWRERPFEVIRQDDLAHAVLDRRTGETLLVRQWVGAMIEPEENRNGSLFSGR